MELFLIVRHNTADTVGVEVSCDLGKLKSGLGKLEQGPLKQIMIVCLEVDLRLAGEHLPVAQQEIRMGKPCRLPGQGSQKLM